MATLRYIAWDILENLKQVSTDTDITFNSCVYWVLVYADRLKSQHKSKIDSGYFLHTYTSVPVSIEPITKRKYITLPSGCYDYDMDNGIHYISYNADIDPCRPTFTSIQFSRTNPSKSRVLYFSDDEFPTPANPYFYRITNTAWFLGVENIGLPYVEVALYSTFDPTTPPNLDEEFNFPQELIPVLQRQILDLGRFVMQIPQERLNDATLDYGNSQVPKTKIISVNENVPQPNNQQE